jgi:hypothetical protein
MTLQASLKQLTTDLDKKATIAQWRSVRDQARVRNQEDTIKKLSLENKELTHMTTELTAQLDEVHAHRLSLSPLDLLSHA